MSEVWEGVSVGLRQIVLVVIEIETTEDEVLRRLGEMDEVERLIEQLRGDAWQRRMKEVRMDAFRR